MWMSKVEYLRLMDVLRQNSELLGRIEELTKAKEFAQNTFDWMKVQFAQVMWEKNCLLEKAAGIPARKMEFASTAEPTTPAPNPYEKKFNPALAYEDMGDDMAERLGVDLQPAVDTIMGAPK